MDKLKDKAVVITGASRGIGRGIAEAFAAEGARLALLARDAERLYHLAELLSSGGIDVVAIRTDVTDEQQVRDAFKQVADRFGRVDILVNNAGVFDGGSIETMSLQSWEKVMAVNLRGPFLCTREVFPMMKSQGGGRIINIGSISAQRVRPNSAAYSTSKHGIWGLTQVTALEGRPYGISCGCLHPGNVDVETLFRARKESGEPVMQPSEIAEAAVCMASLPPHINMLESIVLPVSQDYIGRG